MCVNMSYTVTDYDVPYFTLDVDAGEVGIVGGVDAKDVG